MLFRSILMIHQSRGHFLFRLTSLGFSKRKSRISEFLIPHPNPHTVGTQQHKQTKTVLTLLAKREHKNFSERQHECSYNHVDLLFLVFSKDLYQRGLPMNSDTHVIKVGVTGPLAVGSLEVMMWTLASKSGTFQLGV